MSMWEGLEPLDLPPVVKNKIRDLESQIDARDARIAELETRSDILGDLANMLADDYREQSEKRGVRLAGIKEGVERLGADRNAQRVRAAKAESDLAAAQRELERWRHGQQIEGDYVCPDSLRADNAEARVAELERSYAWSEELRGKALIGYEQLGRDHVAAVSRADRAEAERDEARRKHILSLYRGVDEDLVDADALCSRADAEYGPGQGAHLFPKEPTDG